MRFTLLVFILWLAVALAACVERPAEDATGQEIYIETCARCHGADLSGGVGPALGPRSNAASQPDEFVVGAVTEGRGRMPSFDQTLTSEQIGRVVEYLREVQGS